MTLEVAPSPARVAARHLRASIEMDIYARARILEAAAGRPKWTLSRNLRAFIREGQAQFPDAHPDWFSSRDQGLAASVFQAAKKILLQSGASGKSTPEEIAQNMAAGLTEGGDVRSDVYGDVGKHQGQGILAGKIKPSQSRTTLWGLAQRRAIDTWRKNKRTQSEGEVTDETQSSSSVVLDRSPLDVILSLLSSEKGREFRNWIVNVLHDAPKAQRIVMDLTFEYMAKHHEWPPPTKILDKYVEAMGGEQVVPRTVSIARDRAIKFIKEEMEANPHVLDWIDEYMDLANLGFGGGQLRLAKSIRRVAERFLATQAVK